jgi:hypothetical protein
VQTTCREFNSWDAGNSIPFSTFSVVFEAPDSPDRTVDPSAWMMDPAKKRARLV